MGAEVLLYGYGLVCVSMLAFNLLYGLHLRSDDRRLERRVDRDRLDLRGEEDLMDIFRILIYISATAMTQAIFEEDSGPARARLCAQLDILRRGTAAPSATKT